MKRRDFLKHSMSMVGLGFLPLSKIEKKSALIIANKMDAVKVWTPTVMDAISAAMIFCKENMLIPKKFFYVLGFILKFLSISENIAAIVFQCQPVGITCI